MTLSRSSSYVLATMALIALSGCTDGESAGFILTRDGHMRSETAEVSRDELAYRLGQRAADALGTGWNARVAIQELPTMSAVKADQWGWRKMTITVELFPPTGATQNPAAIAKAESAIGDAAIYRVPNRSDLHFTTTVAATGTIVPGTISYTTVANDTFAGISTAFYGTPQHWRRIADANPAVDGAQLVPGTVLAIPPKP